MLNDEWIVGDSDASEIRLSKFGTHQYIPGGAGISSMNTFILVIISIGREEVNSINLYLMTFDLMAHTLRVCRFGPMGLVELRK